MPGMDVRELFNCLLNIDEENRTCLPKVEGSSTVCSRLRATCNRPPMPAFMNNISRSNTTRLFDADERDL